MLPGSNRGVGMNLGFPDVCNTPVGPATVPIPYPNIALNAQAVPFSPNVYLTMVNALNMGSMIPLTMGDEAGVAHPMIKGPGRYTMGNPIVYVNYLPAINLACPTTGNMMNNGLGAVLVPSITNVFFTRQAEGMTDVVTELAETLDQACVRVSEVEGDSAVVRISGFAHPIPSCLDSALVELTARGVKRICLDLRGNPGGDLNAAARVLDRFVEEGALLFTLESADGDIEERRARGATWPDLSLEVLVDGQTASAAEVVASALAANGRAIIKGGATFGKRTVHVVSPEGYPEIMRWAPPGQGQCDTV